MAEYALKVPGDLLSILLSRRDGLSSLPVTLPFSTKGNTVVSTIFFDCENYYFCYTFSVTFPFYGLSSLFRSKPVLKAITDR